MTGVGLPWLGAIDKVQTTMCPCWGSVD